MLRNAAAASSALLPTEARIECHPWCKVTVTETTVLICGDDERREVTKNALAFEGEHEHWQDVRSPRVSNGRQ